MQKSRILSVTALAGAIIATLLIWVQSTLAVDARTLLVESFTAMGGSVPEATNAKGTFQLTEGSDWDTGEIKIKTRGLDESREQIHTTRGVRTRIFSKGRAASTVDNDKTPLSLEMAASSQSPSFPLPIIGSALSNPDYAFEYVAQEQLDGITSHHIRFWNTYTIDSHLEHLADFSEKHIWIDAATGLPLKMAYDERAGRGAVPAIQVEARYSDLREVDGVIYPFHIERYYNGSLWLDIRIDTVNIGDTVADSDFDVR